MNAISPRANSLPIAAVILRKNSKGNNRAQHQGIQVQWQLTEIQHSGKETFADGLTCARTGCIHSATA